MLRRPLLSLLFGVVLVAIFVGGLARLFVLRYEAGDSYPPYSTLRADPLGTKALAEALGELPGLAVSRNFKPLPKVHPSGPVTLVYAGVGQYALWEDDELLAFDSLVASGSRAIFTFYPVLRPPTEAEEKQAAEEEKEKKEKSENEKSDKKKKPKKDGKKTEKPNNSETKDKTEKKTKDEDKSKDKDAESDEDEATKRKPLTPFETVANRWGFSFDYLREEKGKPENKGQPEEHHATLIEPGGHSEADISWHSVLCFKDLKPQWKVLYMRDFKPVVIERKFGDGTILLASDSYFLSNEALRGERHPHLIARVFDGPPAIIFDEEHNNLRENPGIASLARKYRLHGVVATLLLLAALFVWKNTVRFIPAYRSSAAETEVIAGKESGEGFVNLLRRSIRPSALFDVCVDEWRKAFGHKPRELAKVEELRAQWHTRPANERNPVTAYTTISRVLARKV